MGSSYAFPLNLALKHKDFMYQFRNLPLKTENRLQSLQAATLNEVTELSSESAHFVIHE